MDFIKITVNLKHISNKTDLITISKLKFIVFKSTLLDDFKGFLILFSGFLNFIFFKSKSVLVYFTIKFSYLSLLMIESIE